VTIAHALFLRPRPRGHCSARRGDDNGIHRRRSRSLWFLGDVERSHCAEPVSGWRRRWIRRLHWLYYLVKEREFSASTLTSLSMACAFSAGLCLSVTLMSWWRRYREWSTPSGAPKSTRAARWKRFERAPAAALP